MKKIKDLLKYEYLWGYAAAVLCGCIFVLISASWTSPLFTFEYGYDSSWYIFMGRAIREGFVPYRDFFDLKGPVFFFIEAIGQIIKTGRTGIFVLELFASAVSSVAVIKICRLYLSWKKSFVILFLYYLAYVSLLWGGNTCEEMLLPFSLISLYLTLKYLKRGEIEKGYDLTATFLGISFGMMLLSKPTLASFVVSCILVLIIDLIKKKRYDILLRASLYFLAGALLIILPVCAYFLFNKAFGEFIYSAFIFAFKRSTDYYEKFSVEWEANLCFCYVGFITALISERYDDEKDGRRLLLLISSIVTYLALHLGTPYTYYFITELPVWVLTLVQTGVMVRGVLEKGEKRRFYTFLLIFALELFVCYRSGRPAGDKLIENLNFVRNPDSTYYDGCIEAFEEIPFYERDDVYNLESGMIYYDITGEIPQNKYSVNLPYFMALDPDIKKNVLDYLDVKKPKWIISEHMQDFDDEDTREYVFGHYILYLQTDALEIYRRVEY